MHVHMLAHAHTHEAQILWTRKGWLLSAMDFSLQSLNFAEKMRVADKKELNGLMLGNGVQGKLLSNKMLCIF